MNSMKCDGKQVMVEEDNGYPNGQFYVYINNNGSLYTLKLY